MTRRITNAGFDAGTFSRHQFPPRKVELCAPCAAGVHSKDHTGIGCIRIVDKATHVCKCTVPGQREAVNRIAQRPVRAGRAA